MITEVFRQAIWQYRGRGGRLYRLAIDHDMTPSMLSATLTGARRVEYDERIVRIGEQLGLQPYQCFEDTAAPDRPSGLTTLEVLRSR